MWRTKKGFMLVFLAIMFLTSLLVVTSISPTDTIGAKEPSERFKGYNTERGKWTTGNLGKAYREGDFVSYQARIDKTSKVWGATKFSISFNFHQRSSEAIYVDGFDTSEETGFQWSTQDFLPDGKPIPDANWGTHIPTPDAGESWTSGPKITNYMDAWPPGTSDGTPAGSYPAEKRYFTVEGIPWGSATTHIILFFRAHLALHIIWSEGLESALPTALDGGEFETWTNTWNGASFATGSSRHFFLEYEGVGDKTIPIPIAQYPKTLINGHKYVNDVLFDGWEITLTGELSLGPNLPPIPYTPAPVYTGMSPWTTGEFWFTGIVEGSYKVQEEDRPGFVHENILTSGDGTNEIKNIPEGWGSFNLKRGGTHTVDFYNSVFQDLEVSKTAEPYWERFFDWTIEKTVTPTACEILVGESIDITYTITITRSVSKDVYEVSGTITINNPNPPSVEVYGIILDEVWDGAVSKGSQNLTPEGPILIPPGVSTYPYSITLTPPVQTSKTYTNKATVEVTEPVSKTYQAEKTFNYTSPTNLTDESATVEEDETVPSVFSAVVDWGLHGSPPWAVADSTTIVIHKQITDVSAEPCNWYDIPNTVTLTEIDTGTVHEASALVRIHVSLPPTPPSFDFDHASIPDVIFVGETRTVTMRVVNIGPPESRIYYLTFAAVIKGYDSLQFVGPGYTAHVKIYYNDGTTWEADVAGVLTNQKFSGFGTPGDYWMVTWRVPTTYPAGPYLEGNDQGWLSARAEISFMVKGVATGPTWLTFFPKATEDHHTHGVPLSGVSDRANIWEANGLWYPAHNSYDPYDADIGTGHVFRNPTWTAVPTAYNYSRVLKFVYIWT